MKLKSLILTLALGLGLTTLAQDIHFSQIEHAPLTMNPAMAGANYDLSANVIYKTQWQSVATPYQTIAASVSSILNPQKKMNKRAFLAAGLEFYQDWSGDSKFTTNAIRLHLATHIVMAPEHTLGLGAYAGYGMRNLNTERAQWGSQYNGMEFDSNLSSGEIYAGNIGSKSLGSLDVGAGMVYTYNSSKSRIGSNDSKSLNIGFAAYHVNQPKYHFLATASDKMHMRFTGFANGSFGIPGSKVFIDPGVYFQMQGPAMEILAGSYVKYIFREQSNITNFIDEISGAIGLFYRNQDALIIKAYFDWKGLGVGLAYDFNLFNSLIKVSRSFGGIEAAVRYVIYDYDRRPYNTGGRLFF